MQNLTFIRLFRFIVLQISCTKDDSNPPNNSLISSFTIDPKIGDTETVFVFDASTSTTLEQTSQSLQERWDFDGDGIWEVDWGTDKIANQPTGKPTIILYHFLFCETTGF
ncbi:MAG: hypothetical protein U9R19_08900 [Bacteroidota bacterium]|nr:hypothetical protein [Bacteroidota bacterium]